MQPDYTNHHLYKYLKQLEIDYENASSDKERKEIEEDIRDIEDITKLVSFVYLPF